MPNLEVLRLSMFYLEPFTVSLKLTEVSFELMNNECNFHQLIDLKSNLSGMRNLKCCEINLPHISYYPQVLGGLENSEFLEELRLFVTSKAIVMQTDIEKIASVVYRLKKFKSLAFCDNISLQKKIACNDYFMVLKNGEYRIQRLSTPFTTKNTL